MPITQINTNQYISVATSFGDVKHGFQSSDHNGWIKLDGRLISTLSSNQQTQATALGFTVNLPDATDKYLSQVTAGALGSVSGNANNQITLAQNQLPNVTLNGTTGFQSNDHTHGGVTSTNGNHQHSYRIGALGGFNNSAADGNGSSGSVATTDFGGNHNHSFTTGGQSAGHTHTFTTSSINGNVVQQVTNIKPHTLKANIFVYLGAN